jgi:hypothetical protein
MQWVRMTLFRVRSGVECGVEKIAKRDSNC